MAEQNELRKGTTLPELLIVIGIIAAIALTGTLLLFSRRTTVNLENVTTEATALLREAQSKSVAQEDDGTWGVRFENSTTSVPFFVLFKQPYSTSSRTTFRALPSGVGYITSTVPSGGWIEISFDAVSGIRSGSSSVAFYLESQASVSTTLTVSTSGAVSH